jgi:hypothetical protein
MSNNDIVSILDAELHEVHSTISKLTDTIEKMSIIIENQEMRIQQLEKSGKKTLYTTNGL